MQKILVQHGVGDAAELLRCSHDCHAAYCARHGYGLLTSFSRETERPLHWEKIALLRRVLATSEEQALVVFLDADALIERSEVDFAEALTDEADVGMVLTEYPRLAPFYNTGVIVMRNAPGVRRLWELVWDAGHVARKGWEHPKNEEFALQTVLQTPRAAVPGEGCAIWALGAEWNCWKNNAAKCEAPIVRAWHGEDDTSTLRRMRERIKACH